MFLCRFDDNRLGLVEKRPLENHSGGDAIIRDVTAALKDLPSYQYPFPMGDPLITALPALCERIRSSSSASSLAVSKVRLLSPVANPGKVIGAPVNYQKHLDEVVKDPHLHQQNKSHTLPIHEIGFFLKATSSVIGPSEEVVIRHADRRTDHEVELVAIIGKRANRVSKENALDFVAGYCIGLDITVRGPEDRSLRKSVDTYTVLGPWLATREEIEEPSNLDLSISVNGEVKQKSNTRHMIMNVPELIEFASSFYTLYPGDVLMTGTPDGVGPIVPGDVLRASIKGIGEMVVHVQNASE